MKYILCSILFDGESPQPRFAFSAKNQNEADEKAFKWSQYQHVDHKTTLARLPIDNEKNWQLHDGYIQ